MRRMAKRRKESAKPNDFCPSLFILLAKAMTVAAFVAHRRFLVVIDILRHIWECVHVGENGLQVVLSHVSVITPGHNRIKVSRADFPVPDRFDECGLVVVRNAAWIRSGVGGSHLPSTRAVKRVASRKL